MARTVVLYGCELHAAINSCKVSNRHDAAHTHTEKGQWRCYLGSSFHQFRVELYFSAGKCRNFILGWICHVVQSCQRPKHFSGKGDRFRWRRGASHTHTPALLHPASRQHPADRAVHETPSSPSLVPFMERITSYLPHCHYKGFLPASGWGGRKRPRHRSMLWCGGGGSGGGGC